MGLPVLDKRGASLYKVVGEPPVSVFSLKDKLAPTGILSDAQRPAFLGLL